MAKGNNHPKKETQKPKKAKKIAKPDTEDPSLNSDKNVSEKKESEI